MMAVAQISRPEEGAHPTGCERMTVQFQASDGYRSLGAFWRPDHHPRRVLIGLHGYGDNHRAFDVWGEWSARRGEALFACDQRGFGSGLGIGGDVAWAGVERYSQDVADMVRQVRATLADEDIPVVLMGESMGAGLALVVGAQQAPDIAAVIAAGPAVLADIPNETFWNTLVRTLAQVAPALRYPVNRTSDRALHPHAQRRFGADPEVLHGIRADVHAELVRLCYTASDAAAGVRVPTLVLYGEDDPLIHARSIAALERDLGRMGEVWRLPGVSHLVLQDRDTDRVGNRLARFLDALTESPGCVPSQGAMLP